MKNSDKILHSLLVESNEYTEEEFQSLQEDVKIDAIKTVAVSLLKDLIDNSQSLDMTLIDRSKGDIKNLRELENIQLAINQINDVLDEAEAIYNEELVQQYLRAITKSIFVLNQYSAQFKDGYRMKKSVIILRYQTVVLAIAASVAYLFSALIDFSSGKARLKNNPRLEEISALRTLKQFINSADSGELKLITKDINTIREFYNEIPEDVMGSILEANDVFSTALDGLKNFYSNIDQGGRVTRIIYKAVGIIAALYPMREIIFMIIRSRFKISDIFDQIRNFAHLPQLPSLNKLYQFGTKFRVESEENSRLAQRDVVSANKNMVQQIKAAPRIEDTMAASISTDADYMLDPKVSAQPAAQDDFFF